jgi:hypothetical protein
MDTGHRRFWNINLAKRLTFGPWDVFSMKWPPETNCSPLIFRCSNTTVGIRLSICPSTESNPRKSLKIVYHDLYRRCCVSPRQGGRKPPIFLLNSPATVTTTIVANCVTSMNLKHPIVHHYKLLVRSSSSQKSSLTESLGQQDCTLEGPTDVASLENCIPTINITDDDSPSEEPPRVTRSFDCDILRFRCDEYGGIGRDSENESKDTPGNSSKKRWWSKITLRSLRRHMPPQVPRFSSYAESNRSDETYAPGTIHSNMPYSTNKNESKVSFKNSSYLKTWLGLRGFRSNISLRLFAGSEAVGNPNISPEHVQAPRTKHLEVPTLT